MTPEELRRCRTRLGLSYKGLAALLRMGKHGGRNARRWEAGEVPIPGYAALVLEILTTGELPDLAPFQRYARREKNEDN